MATQVTGSSPGSDVLVAQVASRVVRLALGDRFSLRNHPALVRLGTDLIGSTTIKGTVFNLDGLDLLASTGEASAVSTSSLTVANYTCAPSKYSLAYGYSDFLNAVDQTGVFSTQRLAMSIAISAAMTLTNLIALEIDDWTQVGSTAVTFSHTTFLLAQFALKQALVPPPYLAVLKPKHFTDWQADLEQRGGVTQWRDATASMQVLRGLGLEGFYNGIEVVTSDQVQSANSGADWASGMFGRGALGYKELQLRPAPRSAHVLIDSGPLRVEEVRDGLAGSTDVAGHYYVGTCDIEAARGRTLIGAQ
jgi:hypothetical protein